MIIVIFVTLTKVLLLQRVDSTLTNGFILIHPFIYSLVASTGLLHWKILKQAE
jgi:hypothetical protein